MKIIDSFVHARESERELVWKRYSSFYELLLSSLQNLLSRARYTPRFRDRFCFPVFLPDQQTALIAFCFSDHVDVSLPRRRSLSLVTRSFLTKEGGGLCDGGEDRVMSQKNIWMGGYVDAS